MTAPYNADDDRVASAPAGDGSGGPDAVARIGLLPAMKFAEVIENLRPDLEAVEIRLRKSADINFPLLGDIVDTLIGSGGKRLRPAILLLCAKPFDYEITSLVP